MTVFTDFSVPPVLTQVPEGPIRAVSLPPGAPQDICPNVAAIIMTHGLRSIGNALHTLIAHYNGKTIGDSAIIVGLQTYREVIGLDGETRLVRLMDRDENLLPQTRQALQAMIRHIELCDTFLDGNFVQIGQAWKFDPELGCSRQHIEPINWQPWMDDYKMNLDIANLPPLQSAAYKTFVETAIAQLAAKFSGNDFARPRKGIAAGGLGRAHGALALSVSGRSR